jgi:hypothetical protein
VILELGPKRDLVFDHMADLCRHAAFPDSTVTCNPERYMNRLLIIVKKNPVDRFSQSCYCQASNFSSIKPFQPLIIGLLGGTMSISIFDYTTIYFDSKKNCPYYIIMQSAQLNAINNLEGILVFTRE